MDGDEENNELKLTFRRNQSQCHHSPTSRPTYFHLCMRSYTRASTVSASTSAWNISSENLIAHFQISSLSNLSEGRLGGELRREFKTEAVLTLVLLIHAAIFLAGITIIIPFIIISKNSRSKKFIWELSYLCLVRPGEIIFHFSFLSRNTRLIESYSHSQRKRFSFKLLQKICEMFKMHHIKMLIVAPKLFQCLDYIWIRVVMWMIKSAKLLDKIRQTFGQNPPNLAYLSLS